MLFPFKASPSSQEKPGGVGFSRGLLPAVSVEVRVCWAPSESLQALLKVGHTDPVWNELPASTLKGNTIASRFRKLKTTETPCY